MGIRFNLNKCQFVVSEIKYVGHILTQEGIKPDKHKVEAIQQIKIPKNAKELSRFLGMITYLSRFIPNLSNLNYNLRQLLKKQSMWCWTDVHEKEFNNLKRS